MNTRINCERDQIAAYIDGELDDCARSMLEQHIEECSDCRADLAEQKRLLCALDSALFPKLSLQLPGEFARTVAVRAKSDLSGVRDRNEYRRAIFLCVALLATSLVLLGATNKAVFVIARRALYQVGQLLELVLSALFDLAAGLGIVFRVARSAVVPASEFSRLVEFLLLALAVALLSRLIANYHRTSPID